MFFSFLGPSGRFASLDSRGSFQAVSFLFENGTENHPPPTQKQDFFYPYRTPKSLPEKEGKNAQKIRNSTQGTKGKEGRWFPRFWRIALAGGGFKVRIAGLRRDSRELFAGYENRVFLRINSRCESVGHPLENSNGRLKKGGGRKYSRRTPLPKRVFEPPSFGTFSTPSKAIALSFLYKSPHLSRPEALLEGLRNFSGGCSLVRFLPPYVCTPPYHGPNLRHRAPKGCPDVLPSENAGPNPPAHSCRDVSTLPIFHLVLG